MKPIDASGPHHSRRRAACMEKQSAQSAVQVRRRRRGRSTSVEYIRSWSARIRLASRAVYNTEERRSTLVLLFQVPAHALSDGTPIARATLSLAAFQAGVESPRYVWPIAIIAWIKALISKLRAPRFDIKPRHLIRRNTRSTASSAICSLPNRRRAAPCGRLFVLVKFSRATTTSAQDFKRPRMPCQRARRSKAPLQTRQYE